jgi:hypothetical protein
LDRLISHNFQETITLQNLNGTKTTKEKPRGKERQISIKEEGEREKQRKTE